VVLEVVAIFGLRSVKLRFIVIAIAALRVQTTIVLPNILPVLRDILVVFAQVFPISTDVLFVVCEVATITPNVATIVPEVATVGVDVTLIGGWGSSGCTGLGKGRATEYEQAGQQTAGRRL